MYQPTPFLESNALLALGANDEESARAILEEMGTGGIEELKKATDRLLYLCCDILKTRCSTQPDDGCGTGGVVVP